MVGTAQKKLMEVTMSNNKQTAVEWLIEKIKLKYDIDFYHIKKEINQAKEMHKQEIMECWETAHQAGRFEGKGIAEENWQTFEQYYNEEYGGNK